MSRFGRGGPTPTGSAVEALNDQRRREAEAANRAAWQAERRRLIASARESGKQIPRSKDKP